MTTINKNVKKGGNNNNNNNNNNNSNTPNIEITQAQIEEEERLRALDPPNQNEYGAPCGRCEGELGDSLPYDQLCEDCIKEVKEQQNPDYTPNHGGKRKTNRKKKGKVRKTLKKKHRKSKKSKKTKSSYKKKKLTRKR